MPSSCIAWRLAIASISPASGKRHQAAIRTREVRTSSDIAGVAFASESTRLFRLFTTSPKEHKMSHYRSGYLDSPGRGGVVTAICGYKSCLEALHQPER